MKLWEAWPPRTRWLAAIAVALVLGPVLVWALLVPLADELARHDVGSATGTLHETLHETALDNARGRLLTLAAGLAAVVALIFTARTFHMSREGQVTDRYTKAIEQLGSDKLDVRIGGIYALERIARDSKRDHPAVMDVMTAFIREHSGEPWPLPRIRTEEEEDADLVEFTRPDIQAALTVVGRRIAKHDIGSIDLTRADLTRADLTRAAMTGARLDGANLTSAAMTDAHLDGANLRKANLTGARLVGADLREAHLTRANLHEADLFAASLVGADLTSAVLTGTIFFYPSTPSFYPGSPGADLTDAILTDANLTDAMWPENQPVPPGWERDAEGRLRAAGTGPGPAEATQPLG